MIFTITAISSLVFILDLIAFGWLVTYFFKLKLFLEERVALGLLLGFISLGYIMLFLSYLFGLSVFSLVIFIVLINVFLIWNLTKEVTACLKEEYEDFLKRLKERSWQVFFVVLGVFIFTFGFLAYQLITERNGRYFVQPVHAYGDISLHLGIISSFAYGQNFPIQNPIMSGTPISYPFLFDFITAIFVNPFSLSLPMAVELTGILMVAVIIIILSYFCLNLIKSKFAAALFLLFFFFNGGLGFFYFIRDFQSSGLNIFDFLQHLSSDYTALKDIGFWWINVVISMLLPQRSFLLGLPTAIVILRLFWDLTDKFSINKYILAIILVSLLPLIHIHSLIALLPLLVFLGCLILLKNYTKIVHLFLPAILGAVFVLIVSKIFLQQIQNPLSLIHMQLGWMAKDENIFYFYLKNFAVSLILIPLFITLGFINKYKISYLTFISQIWIILPSIYIFQPWEFDNTKLFIYWYIFSLPLISFYVYKMLVSKNFILIVTSLLLIFGLTFSGFLDNFRLLTGNGTKYEIYSPQAIKMAEFVKYNTLQNAVFLAIDKFDNPVVALAGRRVVVGYHGWLWTYGLNYSQKEVDVRNMLSGQATQDLFRKYNVSYVILFENEQSGYVVNKDYFNQFQLIYNQDGYKIYQI